jgi:predicted nucleotide-binding protein
MQIVEQVKDVLELYDIEYEIAVEEETTAIPVSQKVLSAMRRCQAGVMIVSDDEQTGTPNVSKINNNVLIEIGAAFVLYDQKVVLLWDKTLKVPSNLQGLYRCEFEGNQLSFAVGTRLAKAVKNFRK